MDETHVLINNFSDKVIAKKGQQTVVEKESVDQKAGTTYIGTISMDPAVRFPLYCIAAGTTQGCEKKYKNISVRLCQMDHSKSGWCSDVVMKNYLIWLSQKMQNQPFALVLDVFSAHKRSRHKRLCR